MRASQDTQRAWERAVATQFHKNLACQGRFLKLERNNRDESIKREPKLIPAWQVADLSLVPVDGQDLLEYAKRDNVFRQLRMTDSPDSQDAEMMAGADELLLIYRKFILKRRDCTKNWEREQRFRWTWDMNSMDFLLGAYRCARSLRYSDYAQRKYGEDKWVVKLATVFDYPPEILYGGIPPVPSAAAC